MSFTWVPFYREVAAHVLGYEDRQDALLNVLHEMGKSGLKPIFLQEYQFSGPKMPLKEIDPFTFLANFSFTGDEKAGKMCQWIKKYWKLKTDAPSDFDGRVKVLAQNPWFFASIADGRGRWDISHLWELAEKAINSGLDGIDPELLETCIKIPNIGIKKLTTGLSWIDPASFLSLAGPIVPYIEERGIKLDKKKIQLGDLEEYRELIQKVRSIEPTLLAITHESLCSNRAIELFITNLAPRCGVSCRSWPTASTTD